MIYNTKFLRVQNKDRYRTAASEYYYVADENNTPYLFSMSQIYAAQERAASNPEDIPSVPHINPEDMLQGCGLFTHFLAFASGLIVAGTVALAIIVNVL